MNNSTEFSEMLHSQMSFMYFVSFERIIHLLAKQKML